MCSSDDELMYMSLNSDVYLSLSSRSTLSSPSQAFKHAGAPCTLLLASLFFFSCEFLASYQYMPSRRSLCDLKHKTVLVSVALHLVGRTVLSLLSCVRVHACSVCMHSVTAVAEVLCIPPVTGPRSGRDGLQHKSDAWRCRGSNTFRLTIWVPYLTHLPLDLASHSLLWGGNLMVGAMGLHPCGVWSLKCAQFNCGWLGAPTALEHAECTVNFGCPTGTKATPQSGRCTSI